MTKKSITDYITKLNLNIDIDRYIIPGIRMYIYESSSMKGNSNFVDYALYRNYPDYEYIEEYINELKKDNRDE